MEVTVSLEGLHWLSTHRARHAEVELSDSRVTHKSHQRCASPVVYVFSACVAVTVGDTEVQGISGTLGENLLLCFL